MGRTSRLPPRPGAGGAPGSLLEVLQGVIERTYDMRTGVTDIGRFVIGDEGFRRHYGALQSAGLVHARVESWDSRAWITAGTRGGDARVLVRERGAGLGLSIYYPDRLVRCLERHDPTRRLDDGNVDAFITLVEELDHFLVLADRWRSGGVVSLLDLELHANVTKYLVLKMFVAKMRRTRRLAARDAAWVRRQVFDAGAFVDPDPEVRARYRDAARLAARYASALESIPPGGRVTALRRFHRMAPQEKISHILAA